MARVTVDHIELSENIGRVSITGTVDDAQTAATFMFADLEMTQAEYEAMNDKKRQQLLAEQLVKARRERKPPPGKEYIEIEG